MNTSILKVRKIVYVIRASRWRSSHASRFAAAMLWMYSKGSAGKWGSRRRFGPIKGDCALEEVIRPVDSGPYQGCGSGRYGLRPIAFP
jgi:hypothetical protein